MSVPVLVPAPAPPAAPPKTASSARAAVLFVVPLLLAVAGGAGFVGWKLGSSDAPNSAEKDPHAGHNHPDDPDELIFEQDRWAVNGIRIEPAEVGPLVDRVWRTGRVALNEDRVAHVSPAVEGVIREVPVKLGQTVVAGDVLAVIESREFGQAKLDLAKARVALSAERELAAWTTTTAANAGDLLKELAAGTPIGTLETKFANRPIGDARQQLLTAYSRKTQARSQLESLKRSGAVPDVTMRKAEGDVETADAVYVAITEELRFQSANSARQAGLKLKDAETAMAVARAKMLMLGVSSTAVDTLDPVAEGATASHYTIRAPFSGVIVDKHAVLSERVGPTFQMFVIADLSSVWVQADLFEVDLPLVRGPAGSGVVFRSHPAGMTERPATVLYSGDLIDKSSRALTLTAIAPNADRYLKPGLFVEVGLPRGSDQPVLRVPVSAVLQHEGKSFVFVHEKGAEFKRTDVAVGRTAGDAIEITAGLKPGARIVVDGGFVLKTELLQALLEGGHSH